MSEYQSIKSTKETKMNLIMKKAIDGIEEMLIVIHKNNLKKMEEAKKFAELKANVQKDRS